MIQNIGLNIIIGDWFIADIIGRGIYELVEAGINSSNNTYAIVRLKKLFNQGFIDIGHETTCHPINVEKWNQFKIVVRNKSQLKWVDMEISDIIKKQQQIIRRCNECMYNYLSVTPTHFQGIYPLKFEREYMQIPVANDDSKLSLEAITPSMKKIYLDEYNR